MRDTPGPTDRPTEDWARSGPHRKQGTLAGPTLQLVSAAVFECDVRAITRSLRVLDTSTLAVGCHPPNI